MEKFTAEYPEPTNDTRESIEALKSIHRGVWAEKLSNGQELPLGGSLFSKELTTKLELDFEVFEDQLSNFIEQNIRTVYEQNKQSVIYWLKKVGSDIDPYTYFVCYQVQQKIHELLEVDPNNPNLFEREKMYRSDKPPKLSELKGKTACGERAAMGQYLLQKAGIESAYVSGITMQEVADTDEFPKDHSFIVLKNPTEPNATLILDVARPISQHVPRVLKTDVPFTYELLRDKDELLVGATEVLQGGRLWFGVGEPVAGQHRTEEKQAWKKKRTFQP